MTRVLILGGGQLAMLLQQACQDLPIDCVSLSPMEDCPARHAGGDVIIGDYQDPKLQATFKQFDIITFENENIDLSSLQQLPLNFRPTCQAVTAAQDRLLEKQLFTHLDIPCAPYYAVSDHDDLQAGTEHVGLPCVLKTRRQGYDGKGQIWLHQASDIASAWEDIQQQDAILEARQDFEFEVSQIATRDIHGHIAYFPLTHNHHQHGILQLSLAPYDNETLQQQAQTYVKRLLEHWDYVGTLAVEFFVVKQQLIANETAPRVHNSGHWTIEGCNTSQFQQHMRAISGLKIERPIAHGYSAMINCIGNEPASIPQLPGINFHTYFKQARPKRKLAHLTINQADLESRDKLVAQWMEKLAQV